MNNPNAIQQNDLLRAALLATGVRSEKKLGTFTESTTPEGKTTRIKLFNTGVVTKVGLLVTANVTVGTATATLSPRAPWNVIKQIKLTDFEGVDRVNCSGYELWLLNSVRDRSPAFINNEGLASISTMPLTQTAVGTGNIEFYIELPIAVDAERDLRGAIFAQVAVGEMFLNITWNDDFHSTTEDGSVYNGGGTSTVVVNSIACEVYQHYIQPQQVGGQTPLPLMDLSTVYEINGNMRLTDNLSNGQEKLISYPNVRSVLACYVTWQNAGVLSNNISNFTLKVNGNNILKEASLKKQLMTQRQRINGDLKNGTFFFDHRARPIETAAYGNVQLGLTLGEAPSGSYYMSQMFESLYPKGTILPGIAQA